VRRRFSMLHRVVFSKMSNDKARKHIGPILPLAVLLLSINLSCAVAPQQEGSQSTGKVRPDVASVAQPKPGDLKTVDGVEYIYGKNVRWPTMPYEPEYVWVRRDQYASRLFDSLTEALSNRADDRKEIEELQRRIERLEKEINKLDAGREAPQER
jgi:hypothetical protein